jgi:hypothetical protein
MQINIRHICRVAGYEITNRKGQDMRVKEKQAGKWVFVPNASLPPEEQERIKEQEVMEMLSVRYAIPGGNPFAAVDEWNDYFPGSNNYQKKADGCWSKHRRQLNTRCHQCQFGLVSHGR